MARQWAFESVASTAFAKDTDSSGEERHALKSFNDLFSLLGFDPQQNMRIIVQQAARILRCPCALYNRLDDHQAMLVSWAGFNLPPDFPKKSPAKGHICFEATMKSRNQAMVLPDLSRTPDWQSDSYVQRFGLRAYLGYPITTSDRIVGSLCVADTRPRRFDASDIDAISALGKALSLEEERSRGRDELARNEKQYRQLYKMLRLMADNVPDCIWAKDLDGRYIFANQATCDKLLKCKHPEDAVGRTDPDFTRLEESLGYQHAIADIMTDSAQVVRLKKPGRFLKNGRVRNRTLMLDVHYSPFWGENGEIIGTVGCGRDVGTEKRAETALWESERRFRDLFNHAPMMQFSMDCTDRLTGASDLWLENMGYRRREVLGRRAADFMSDQSREQMLNRCLPELIKSGSMQPCPVLYVTRDGRTLEVVQSARAEKDADGNYAGAIVFLAAAAEPQKGERSSEQMATRLLRARKMETIATLAGGIAHQFNNALAVILGNLELMELDGPPNDKISRHVTPISQASQKMVQLTSQLLVYAQGGKFQTRIVPAHSIVTETLQLISHSLGPHVELSTDLSADGAFVEADTAQMQMLLTAVLTNASEAIDDRGLVRIGLSRIEVARAGDPAYPGLKPGPYVLLEIVDNGKGMDELSLARIFEPFFTTKFQGRGLGMAAVYGIVKKHNGYIYVFSEPGRGTRVEIYLPQAQPPAETDETAWSGAEARSGTALIVEDEELVLEIHTSILKRMGYEVLEARTGREALSLIRDYNGPIEFVLLDVALPDMNGTQIYPLLMQARPGLKVIVCSGFTMDGPATEILKAGAQSFIQKPFTATALSAVLQEVLGQQGAPNAYN